MKERLTTDKSQLYLSATATPPIDPTIVHYRTLISLLRLTGETAKLKQMKSAPLPRLAFWGFREA